MRLRFAAVLVLGCLLTFGASAQETAGRHSLPDEIADLLTGSPVAEPVVDPRRRHALLVHKRELLHRERLAEPVVSIAGRKLNPRTHSLHAPLDYYALSLVDLATGRETAIPLPPDVTVGYPRWAPDGSRFAFTVTDPSGTALWIGDPAEGRARPVADAVNAGYGLPCIWMPDGRDVLCRLVTGEGPDLSEPLSVAQDWRRRLDPAKTFAQPVPLSRRLVEHLLESRLTLIDGESGAKRTIGEAAAYQQVQAAPSGAFLLVRRTAEPYPRINGIDDEVEIVEVRDRTGRVVATLPPSRRAVQWHPSKPATLAWVERADGLDRVMTQAAPFESPPEVFFETEHGFAGVQWLEGLDSALVSEYDAAARTTRVWHAAAAGAPRLLAQHSIDAPAALGLPLTKTNRWGKTVVAVHEGAIYLSGSEAARSGARPYLARLRLHDGAERRLWAHGGEGYETVIGLLADDASRLLTRLESPGRAPNYYVADLAAPARVQVTDNQPAGTALAGAERIALRFRRHDGYPLSATLYLPPGYDSNEPLPLVVWAYPKRVGGEPPLSTGGPEMERYMSLNRAFKLFFLLEGYAVLDDVSMPIVGQDAEANDSFIQQVIENARAALEAAAETGLVDRRRTGVAGHSYGAFMVANLLAHSDLFKAGAALSGAYNRTLTPFGFQTERRTLWEAPETYLAMSPILFSNRIDAPLLLVHGTLDENAGTPVIQSTRFYEAIRGTGGNAELLLLPWEGHAYRARESVLETASAMLEWFDRYLKAAPASASGAQPRLAEQQRAGAIEPPSLRFDLQALEP